MKVYHGSNEKITMPNISSGRSSLDFGKGFYVTSSYEQACNWARRKTARVLKGIPIVNIYDMPNDILINQDVLLKVFSKADAEWLDFVIANRNEEYNKTQFDIVFGPVADDSVIRIIRMYINGIYDKEEAIKRFKTEILDNQIVFATEKALQFITFTGAKIL